MSELEVDVFLPQPETGRPHAGTYAPLLHSVVGALEADAGWLIVADDPAATEPLAAWDPAELGEPRGWLGGRFLRLLVERNRPIAVYDGHEGIGRDRFECAVGAPATVPPTGRVAICAGFAGRPTLGAQQLVWVAERFASLAALQLHDDGLFGRLIGGSVQDSLTGCLTYGRLIDAIDSEISRCARLGHRLACCFLDLDGFKRVNEEQGHLAGNRVLAGAGEALRGMVRPYDLVGRFGGDEFVVVLPETGLGEAQWLADRLRSALCVAASAAAGTRVGVTSGEAEWSDGMSTGDLLERADVTLRIAKRGRLNGNGGPP
jgi:diguanylate cyclase (GGDEF)-like protein